MVDINQKIDIAFTAIQLILVFVIFLFTLFYPEIQNVKREDSKEESIQARKNLANKVKDVFWGKCIILVSSSLLAFLLFLPVFLQVLIDLIYSFKFSYENYCFTLVFLFICCFLYWSIKLSKQLFNRIQDLRKLKRIETIKYLFRGKK